MPCDKAKLHLKANPKPYAVRHLCFSAKVKFHKKRKQVYNTNILVYHKYVSQLTVTRDLVSFKFNTVHPVVCM
jgi:hypothetical protein